MSKLLFIGPLFPPLQSAQGMGHSLRGGIQKIPKGGPLASLNKTTVAALKRDNRNVAVLRPGMILIVQQAR